MKASEMTNEQLAIYLTVQSHFLQVQDAKDALLEAAARLRLPCQKNAKCDSLAEMLETERRNVDSLRAKLKVAENALDTLVTELDEVVQYDGDGNPVITCVCFELDEARKEAKNALAANLEKGESK